MKTLLLLATVLMLAAFPAAAQKAQKAQKAQTSQSKAMKGTEITALLKDGKTIRVTSAGKGYTGEVVLTADGKGAGTGKTSDGKTVQLAGTWSIKKNRFCHLWTGVDTKEVCERWIMIEPKKIRVVVKKQETAVIAWD
jgi:hypothetical protein